MAQPMIPNLWPNQLASALTDGTLIEIAGYDGHYRWGPGCGPADLPCAVETDSGDCEDLWQCECGECVELQRQLAEDAHDDQRKLDARNDADRATMRRWGDY